MLRLKNIKKNAAPFSNARTLFDTGSSFLRNNAPVKEAELKLAAHVACHSSTYTVDHLGSVVEEISKKGISLHRTKCTALINSVIGPVVHEDLLEDVGNGPYSLIVDESTDVTTKKQLCIVIRYYSKKLSRIISTFAGMINIVAGDSLTIANALFKFLDENKLSILNCIGLATDGCNTMCGQHNSVLRKFHDRNPHIVYIKCVCHSLQLSASKAVSVLPRNVEYMVSQTYSWFSNATQRLQKYSELYKTINVGESPLKILQLSDTRWLAISECINRILSQYVELKLHFHLTKDSERSYAAELLYQMYSDNINLIYLKFLQPIVSELNRLNKIFQLDKPDPAKLLTELLTFYRSLLERIGLPKTFQSWQDIMEFNLSDENLLPLDAVDFGVQFRLALFEANGISDLAEQDMKRRCRDYMLELSKEIRKRLPDNIKQLEALKFLSPSHTLSSSKPRIDDLPFFHLFKGDVGKAEQQWRVIHTLEWNNAEDGKTEDFWVEVSAYTDTAGDRNFEDLGNFALSLLALPFSNAAVERSFSQMSLIKNKLRNRLEQNSLLNIMRIRAYMQRRNICCHEFKPSPRMLSLFTAEIYSAPPEKGGKRASMSKIKQP